MATWLFAEQTAAATPTPDGSTTFISLYCDSSTGQLTVKYPTATTAQLALLNSSATFTSVAVTGLTGATAASRYVGATTSGQPVSGTFAKGDYIVDESGAFWVCTTAGNPGTWVQIGGSGAVASVSGTAPIVSSGGTTPTISITAATDLAAGSMSAADKTKLDGITAGAAVASVSGTAPIVSSGGTTPAISISAATTSAAGSMSATNMQKERLFIDPIADYGCKFDHKLSFDGATTGGAVITSATIGFVAADVGKKIVLSSAGAAGAQYAGTISSLNSSTSVNVSPSTSSAVSSKGLQVYTDDLPAWTNIINDINNSTYPGAVIAIETPNAPTAFGVSTFTGRSGVSSFLPAITKQIRISGYGGFTNSNIGNYWQQGGCCIAYAGASSAPTAFGAVLTLAPTAGASNPNLKAVVLEHFWIDCRNGDQNEALKGISMQSCFAYHIDDVFIQDPLAIGIEYLVIQPGTAGALGEAKDCSRGMTTKTGVRVLDTTIGATTSPTTTTSAITLTTSGQSLTLAAANGLPTSGYVWVMTNSGYPVLVNYTGGGGTTTLTGCTVSSQDTINAPTTVSGSNVVQAAVSNGCGFLLDGDITANANLAQYETCIVVHGTTWGPAAIDLRNSDSNEFTNCVVNGGNPAVINAINRVTKLGVQMNGSNTNQTLAARNNCFKSGSAGAGGVAQMGLTSTGTRLAAQAGPNYWRDYQLGNGEAIPIAEGTSYFQWNPNGGTGDGTCPSPVLALAAGQAIAAATATLITGSLLAIPPQGFQVGTTFRWTIYATKTAGGLAARTFNVRIGTTGSATDGVVAAITSAAGTAAADVGIFTITFTVVSLGATAAAVCQFWMTHDLEITGWSTITSQVVNATMSTFNSTTAQQFISVSLTTGAAETPTIIACTCEVVKPSNP